MQSTGKTVDIHKLHGALIRSFIKYVLPPLVKAATVPNKIYPVVVGGMDVERCLNLTRATRDFVRQLSVNDIDMKFICLDDASESLQATDAVRRALVASAFKASNSDLQKAVSAAGLEKAKVAVRFETSSRYADPPYPGEIINMVHDKVRQHKLVSTSVTYYNSTDGSLLSKLSFLDTTVDGPDSIRSMYTEHAELFNKTIARAKLEQLFKFPKIKDIVPVEDYKGVLYASCKWVYTDTVRLLDYYATLVATAPKETMPPAQQKFMLKKFVKYLVKFAVLYIHVNQKEKDNQALQKTFEKAQELYASIMDNNRSSNMMTKLDPQFFRLAWFVKHKLDKYTNLKQLRAEIRQALFEPRQQLLRKAIIRTQ